MVVRLDPKLLRRYLWRWGPLIYYYNAECDGPNQKVLNYMHAMAYVYPSLNVYEINWKKQISKIPETDLQDMNKIFLYFDGVKRIEENEPNENQIINVFNLCVKFHNQIIERKMNNIGKGKLTFQNIRKRPLHKREISHDESILNEKYKKSLFKKKINIYMDEKIKKIVRFRLRCKAKIEEKTKDVSGKPKNENSKIFSYSKLQNYTQTYTQHKFVNNISKNEFQNKYGGLILQNSIFPIKNQMLTFKYIPMNILYSQNILQFQNQVILDFKESSSKYKIVNQFERNQNTKNEILSSKNILERVDREKTNTFIQKEKNIETKKSFPDISENVKYNTTVACSQTKNLTRKKCEKYLNLEKAFGDKWFYHVKIGDLPSDIMNE